MLQRYKLDEQQALICSKAAQKTQHLHQHSMLRSSAQRSSQRECSVASQVSVSHSGSVSINAIAIAIVETPANCNSAMLCSSLADAFVLTICPRIFASVVLVHIQQVLLAFRISVVGSQIEVSTSNLFF